MWFLKALGVVVLVIIIGLLIMAEFEEDELDRYSEPKRSDEDAS